MGHFRSYLMIPRDPGFGTAFGDPLDRDVTPLQRLPGALDRTIGVVPRSQYTRPGESWPAETNYSYSELHFYMFQTELYSAVKRPSVLGNGMRARSIARGCSSPRRPPKPGR